MFSIREMLENFKRIIIVSKKPDREEFIQTAKICAVGIGLIGLIGFVLFVLSVIVIG